MARLLHAQGEPVAVLALMNCAPPNSSYTRIRWTPLFLLKFLRSLCGWAAYFTQWTPRQRRGFFRWKTQAFKRRMGRLFGWFPTGPAGGGAQRLFGPGGYPPGRGPPSGSYIPPLPAL